MKKKLLLFTLLFSFFISDAYSQSTICGYKYRKRITFDPTKVSGTTDLTDFPALINITSDNDLRVVGSSGHVQSSNGYDIIFTDDDGVTLLNFQLESYTSTTGQLIAWVKIPSLSTSIKTYIYMYYGNTATVTDQSSTGAWDANYKGVYHLNANYNDGSTAVNHATNNGMTLGTGFIANGIICNSTLDYVTMPVTGWSATAGTYEVWAKATAAWSATEAYFIGHTTLAAYANRVQLYDVGGKLRIGIGDQHSIGGDIATLATNTWYSIAVTNSGGTFKVYLNGAQVYSGTYANHATMGSASIGNDGNTITGGNNEGIASGVIDEVKISSAARSADWITTEYNNQNSPSTFYTVSGEPKRWTGSSNSNWSASANWTPSGAPAANDDVTITNGSNQPTINVAPNQLYSLWVQSGATLSMSSQTLAIKFDITNCGTITGNTSTLNMNSTSTEIQNQYLSGSGTFNFNNVTVNNTFSPSPTLVLNKDVSVAAALTLTSGITYTTTANILNLTSTASATSGSATSFVSGPMTKAGTTAFIFPVGKGTSWRRIGIGTPGSSTTFRAEYFNTAYVNVASVTAPIVDVSSMEYWALDQAVGSGSAIVSLYWENATASGINNCPDLTVAHWTGSAWDEKAGTATGTCSGTGTGIVSSNIAVTTFSPFTFGSKTNSVNPLPIELTHFTADICAQNVCLNWATSTENNNDYFTIEKTKDGSSFETVGIVDGAGNSTALINYSLNDNAPYEGISYYRLKQTDFDGNLFYSGLEEVDFSSENTFSVDVFPNPNNGENINMNITAGKGEEILVMVYDVTGRESYSKVIITEDNGKNVYAIDPAFKLASGVYLISATSKQEVINKKLIVK